MHAPFLGMHQEPKKQKPPEHQGGHFEETRFRNSVFRASSGSAAQGTVASPGPVAGSDVTIGPLLMLVHLLAVAIDRCQRYSGTGIGAQVGRGVPQRGPSQLDQLHRLVLSDPWTLLFHPLDGFILAADRPIFLVSFFHVVTSFDGAVQGMYDSAASSRGWKWPIKLNLKRPQ